MYAYIVYDAYIITYDDTYSCDVLYKAYQRLLGIMLTAKMLI